MRAFCWIDFALDTIRLPQAGGGTEEPIYSQALLLEPGHGLPPPPASNRFAIRGSNKFRGTTEDTTHGPVGRPCQSESISH